MIQSGTVSFSDMYFFCDEIVDATEKSGLKANISRSTVSFDPNIKSEDDARFHESIKLFEKYHNYADGRIKIDMSIHAEYSTVASSCRYISDFALENDLAIQLHLSETKAEHEECIGRHGVTPARFFEQNGVFRVPVVAAHCVHLTDDDIQIMAMNGATAVHNPSSNLKLGSGVMRLSEMAKSGMNLTLGTDGAASNNTIDIMKEAYLAAILQKGMTGRTDEFSSSFFVSMLTENGAKMQGRADCGKIQSGCRADLVVLDMDMIHTLPVYDPCDSFLYSSNSHNVIMTMVDGKILYENGEFKTLDIEKVKADFKNIIKTYFQN
jgi:5-methylthioadenosine/S-adenosylhomocysteine deaminase